MRADVAARTAQQEQDDLLDIEDVVGKRVIATRLMGNVTIGEEHAPAALEVLQMETLAELSRADATSNARPLLRATAHRVVDLGDGAATAEATSWWETMTAAGGEGMVVKPVDPRL